MKTIPLSQGKVALVDDDDYGRVCQYKWWAARHGNSYRARAKIKGWGRPGSSVSMHRFILELRSPLAVVDHRDHDGLNNQKCNLRICSQLENMRNLKKKKQGATSKYKGVSFHKRDRKWACRIQVSGKLFNVGMFVLEIDAARAYDEAALKYFGEFAYLNFPETKVVRDGLPEQTDK